MDTIGGTISAVFTSITGYGWAVYFGVSAVAVGVGVAVEYVRTKGNK